MFRTPFLSNGEHGVVLSLTQGCSSKLPKPVKPDKPYCLTVLQAGASMHRCPQGWVPPAAQEGASAPCFSPGFWRLSGSISFYGLQMLHFSSLPSCSH